MPTPSSTALLVIDVQYDFLPGGSLAVADGDQVLPVVRDLLKGKWALVAVSQDYHPPGHVSLTHGKEPFVAIDVPNPYMHEENQPATISQMLWPDHCVQASRGAKIEDSVLASLAGWLDRGRAIFVQKGTNKALDAYSAFSVFPQPADDGEPAPTRPRIASNAQLAADLRAGGITTVFVVGLATDYCVRATALDAKSAGFDVYVVREGVRAVGGQEATEPAFTEFGSAGVNVIGVDDDVLRELL